MPRRGGLAADRAAPRAGGERRHGILRHPSDIVSSRHDVKSAALAVRLNGKPDLSPEAGFEPAQAGPDPAAQRRPDRPADDEPPIAGRAGPGFAPDETPRPPGGSHPRFADALPFP